MKTFIINSLAYTFGIIFIITGISLLTERFWFGFMSILTGILLLPIISKILKRTYNFNFTRWTKGIVITILLAATGQINDQVYEAPKRKRELVEIQARVKQEAQEKERQEKLRIEKEKKVDSLINLAKNNTKSLGTQATIKILNQALAEVPNDSQKSIIYETIGDIFKDIGNFQEAIQKYDSVKLGYDETQRLAEIHYKRGICFHQLGNIAKAVFDMKEAINQGHQKAENYHNQINPEITEMIGYETQCCDGTTSNATGRGACSHHGGVCGSRPVYSTYRKY